MHQLYLISEIRDIAFECPRIHRTINAIRFRLALERILSGMDDFGRKELGVGANLHNRQLLSQLVAFATYFNLFGVVSSVYTFHCVSSCELERSFQPIMVNTYDADGEFIAASTISFMLANGLIRPKAMKLAVGSSGCAACQNRSPPEQYIITGKGMDILGILLEKFDLPME